MKIRFLSVLCFTLTLALPAIAQDAAATAEPPAAVDAPATAEPEQEKDSHTLAVEEFLDVMKMEETTEKTINQMLQMQVQQQPALAAFSDVMREFLQKHLSYDSIKQPMIELYKSEFTEDEIKQLTEFYRTPVGRKAVEKLPTLSAAGAQLGMQRVQANMAELQQAIAARQAQLKTE